MARDYEMVDGSGGASRVANSVSRSPSRRPDSAERLGGLLEPAHADAAIGLDRGLDDLVALVSAATTAARRTGTSPEHLAAVICDGVDGSSA
jgi:hypothetical protein